VKKSEIILNGFCPDMKKKKKAGGEKRGGRKILKKPATYEKGGRHARTPPRFRDVTWRRYGTNKKPNLKITRTPSTEKLASKPDRGDERRSTGSH